MKKPSIQDDTHSDYQAVKRQAQAAMHRGVWTDRFENRFVPLAEREMRCDLPKDAIRKISEGKHYASYRGIPMAKDPFDIVLYETLFFEIQPRSIVELGAYTGASALWMADTLDTFGIDAHVYSVDIDITLVEPLATASPRVTFMEGDCNQIEALFPAEMLRELPQPLVLIDDAHVNIDRVYSHFHEHALRVGDYLIVEDTIPWIPGSFGPGESESEWGEWKWDEIREFFLQHTDAFLVDRYYTDFYGYNATWNWNGFFKKVA